MSDAPHPPRAMPLPPSPAAAPRGPRAFMLGEGAEPGHAAIEHQPDFTAAPPPAPAPAARRGWLGGFILSALAGLLVLAALDSLWALAVSLEAKAPWLGRAALVLAGLAAAGIAAFLAAEAIALLRLRRAEALRRQAAEFAGAPDPAKAAALLRRLDRFYADDPGSTAARAEIRRALGEIHDPLTLVAIAERALFRAKDAAARQAIAEAASRVSIVTALSPRALVDVAFVLFQSIRLVRALSAIYGGRASGLGLLRLAARVFGHLAITGGVAMADQLVSQFVGAGLAARISAKLGEGVLNGILTARIGLAALDLCRPLPFMACEPVILSEVVKNTIKQEKVAENPAAQT
ncbi:TIGR01620 family protein [Rhabdaerophilum calidifontis]|uniref:TIGR01620 family protein n=1 Tax=Rhabdaerophilum calidifontis TaxID=2604328 RepID=UPI00123AC3C2|nr:TIGR01620 family protein [Rhabdaerophilum calidifontis]